ncbi:AraC family transcriptional regulator [Lachnospiraceae bacterium 56-18]|jgi:AraC-like DNA-binding protein|uniref:AraC family transcriptional regulator n=1 Tax=Sporofaciens sp. JLR.KK001 TaxID=3112621 RepID=UPI002FEEEBC0
MARTVGIGCKSMTGRNISYIPLTATPFRRSDQHREAGIVNPELTKYIRCFWGSKKPYREIRESIDTSVIIPDTCVDIIYQIDHTESTVTGNFCGINDASFLYREQARTGHLVSVFAIRFYAWGAYPFAEASLTDTLNEYCDVPSRFRRLDEILRPQLLEKQSLKERIAIAEKIFLDQLSAIRQNDSIDNAVKQILLHKGALSAKTLARESFISSRQQERLFREYIGITPKKLCNLVRYQCLWSEIISNPNFRILDAVCKYGYTDQSHLMREFKRYHTMNIKEAKSFAYKDVANIQYIQRES